MDAATPTDSVRAGPPPRPGGVFDELTHVLDSARETLSGFLELFSLEARRAGLALVGMMIAGLVAALCIVTGWMWMMAAVAMLVVSLGLVPLAAALVTAAISMAAGAAVIFWCIAASRNLLFAATRRQLLGASRVKGAQP
jgi:uncharacterized membrane protein YqjE